MRARLGTWIIAAGIVLAAAGSAAAQELAGSFDQLRVLVKTGDVLTVTDASGRQVSGRLTELSATTLALDGKDGPMSVAEGNVTTIRQRRHGDLAKGAKIGAAVGAGFGLLGGLAIATSCRECAGLALAISGFYAGFGAGVGVGVAAMTTHDAVIFSGSRPSAGKLAVAPLVSHQRRGVMVSLGF